jgi:beta-galactosidase
MSSFTGGYPWISAWCGDIDITGDRRPQSFYREIMWGRRAAPFIGVRRPEHHGRQVVHAGPWSWSDVLDSWTWPIADGLPVTVEVYAAAPEVELVVNQISLGRQPAGPEHRFRAVFETTYSRGVLESVAWDGDREIARTTLRSSEGPTHLDVQAERATVSCDGTDLAFVRISLLDGWGTVDNTADRPVSVVVDGPGVLLGLASARPATTFDGRALAVIRPTGPGTLTVTVTADGVEHATTSVTVAGP